ncbi:MAG: ATP-binding cassette domain-containing protein [Bacteroidota bacterium]
MVQLKNVEKKYAQHLVLHIPTFQFDKGINWIKGANGTGKTTLLKAVAGLIPFKGDILYNGTSLKTNPLDYKRKVGWSEAEPLFPPFMSGHEFDFVVSQYPGSIQERN